jgi:S1-C subfamily serine protease
MRPIPAPVLAFLASLAASVVPAAALTPAVAPLPLVRPMPPDPLRAPPGMAGPASGSGFFAARHSVVTAAHVVAGCQAIVLASPHMAPAAARVVAADEGHDIAVLHSDGPAPAVLALGAAVPGRVRVMGFPGPARRGAVAAETRASLANARIAPSAALERDPAALLWLQDRAIVQGFSGGPVLDPASGRVVGLVRATLDPGLAARHYGIVLPDLAIGPGLAPLRAMLGAGMEDSADATGAAERAVVNVLCWQ